MGKRDNLQGLDDRESIRDPLRTAAKFNQLLRAFNDLNTTGTVTLTANATTTTVTDSRIKSTSAVQFHPTTQNAAAMLDFGGGAFYVSTITANTSFVITHPNTPDTDRIFRYTIIG